MKKEIKQIIIYIVLMLLVVFMWLISPMILPAGAFRTTRYCSWNGPCVEPQPMVGIAVTIILVILFIVLSVLLIRSIIKVKKK